MASPQNIVAVVFDFDDTLTDDSTTKLLESHRINVAEFWGQVSDYVQQGWDTTLAYLHLLLEKVGEHKPLGSLSNADLRAFGGTLELYPGLPELFGELRDSVQQYEISRPHIEFYVVSGGLEEIIRGSKIASIMSGIWGCRLAEGAEGVIRNVMNVVSFTEKTKCLFEINKGVVKKSRTTPYAVNELVREEDRRIPFRNMIYLGDGLTDVPCFSLVQKYGGFAFGVFDPPKEGSPKKAFEKLLVPKRVTTMNSPKYRKSDDLGALLRAAVSHICDKMELSSQTAG